MAKTYKKISIIGAGISGIGKEIIIEKETVLLHKGELKWLVNVL